MKTEEEIKQACDEAYKKAGHNAYFANGFYAGVEYASQKQESISISEWKPKDYQIVLWFDSRDNNWNVGYFVPSQPKQ